jgi:hypothetical protein
LRASAAIHSFFRYVLDTDPELAALVSASWRSWRLVAGSSITATCMRAVSKIDDVVDHVPGKTAYGLRDVFQHVSLNGTHGTIDASRIKPGLSKTWRRLVRLGRSVGSKLCGLCQDRTDLRYGVNAVAARTAWFKRRVFRS